jgi:hypothetical protein
MKRIVVVLLAISRAVVADPKVEIDLGQLGAKRPHAAAAATQVAPREPRMPAVLARQMGHAENAQLYTQLLAGFDQIVDEGRFAKRDVAVAAAIYTAGAYFAYRGSEVTDQGVAAITAQLHDQLAALPAFASMAMEQKQDMYESFAILGALMWMQSKQTPGDAALRATAKSYLDALFGGRGDALQITDRGLSAAGVAPAPAATIAPATSNGVGTIALLMWNGNAMAGTEWTMVAFSDGTLYDGYPDDLLAFDRAAARAANPKKWGRWRKGGQFGYQSNFGKRWEDIRGVQLLAAKRGARFAGTYRRRRTASYGTGASSYRGNTLVLTGDGRFDTEVVTHFTTQSNINHAAGEAVASASGGTNGGVWNAGRAHGRTAGTSDHGGTYEVDGFSITLRFDSGKVERKSFAVADHGEWVHIGGLMMPRVSDK